MTARQDASDEDSVADFERELAMLLDCLPQRLAEAVAREQGDDDLLEVVLDLGRVPEARFAGRAVALADDEVTEADLEHVTVLVGEFGGDNRAGLERTLHRISAIRNRSSAVVGLTCRVGRAVHGSAGAIEDIILSGKSVLLVGRPGVGKTTMLRETARVLADRADKRVIIVDTSNEIAGDGDIPHPAIGRARRLQVAMPSRQHAVMIEAVENHMPEVIIIDEMGTEAEALAARTIAERGVQLIATAHGNTLENLLANPTLADLVGGIHTVTLSDEEARRRRTQKTVLERRAPPTFDALAEIQSWARVAVHHDVAQTVDRVLRGQTAMPEIRTLMPDGAIERSHAAAPKNAPPAPATQVREPSSDAPAHANRTLRVFPFGVSTDRLASEGRMSGLSVVTVDTPDSADVVVTTKAHYRRRPRPILAAEGLGKPVYVLRRNALDQIRYFLRSLADLDTTTDDATVAEAVSEAEAGIERISRGEHSVELAPQSAFVRRIQHRVAERARRRSVSVGREPERRVTILDS